MIQFTMPYQLDNAQTAFVYAAAESSGNLFQTVSVVETASADDAERLESQRQRR